MHRDFWLFLAWVALIGFCLNFGRRFNGLFEGPAWPVGAAALSVAAMACLALAWHFWRGLPPGLRTRRGAMLAGALAGLALVAWLQPKLIERTHVIIYGGLGVLAYRLVGRKKSGPAQMGWAIALCALVGGLDELGQHLHPDRVGDLCDAATNLAAGALGVLAAGALKAPSAPPR